MRRFVLDTGILLSILKSDTIYETIEKDLRLDESDIAIILPIAVKAEILTIAHKRQWGKNKFEALRKLLEGFFIYSPDNKIVDAYVLIDVYSHNKLSGNLLGESITMGKNDIWIVATAVTTNSILVTLDGGYKHLIGKKLNGLTFEIKDYSYLR